MSSKICVRKFDQTSNTWIHQNRHQQSQKLLYLYSLPFYSYLTCPIPGCTKGFTIKHQLTKHLQTAHANTHDAAVAAAAPRRIAVKRIMTAQGKHNCYFESCDAYFDTSDQLNDHLTGTHGLSVVRNAGKRSKMELMFHEQLKNQQNATAAAVASITGEYIDQRSVVAGGSAAIADKVAQQQQHNNVLNNEKQRTSNAMTTAISNISKDTEQQQQQQHSVGAVITVANAPNNLKCHLCNIFYNNERDLKVHNFYKHPQMDQQHVANAHH